MQQLYDTEHQHC